MKRVKKFAAVLLTMIMALLMGMSALAAADTDKGTIIVDNPLEGQDYTAYKIFDVKYNGNAYAYEIKETSEWYETVKSYNGIKLTEILDTKVYVVEKTNNFSAAGFANLLKANTTGKTGTPLTKSGGKATVTGLELGYYFVASSTGALCNLTTTDPSTTIHDKNDMPFDKKEDKANAEVGEVVHYTITGKVPDTLGFKNYTYEISDTMSEGLTFMKDVVVKVGNTTLDNAKYTYANNAAGNGFVLTIKVMDLQDQVGEEITVTYSATVNEKAVAVISKNKAELKYSNDPTDGSKTTTVTDEEKVYNAKIVIDKYKTGSTTTKLADAKFVLKNADGKFYKYTAATGAASAKVEWVDSQDNATVVVTDTSGAAEILGLKNGTYYLKETEAPIGYNMLTKEVEVKINGNDTDLGTLTVTSEIENNTGAILPETGGMGTTLFYALGAVLAVGAGVLLIVKRRMNTAE